MVVEAEDWIEILVEGKKVFAGEGLTVRAMTGLLSALGHTAIHYWVGEDAEENLILPELCRYRGSWSGGCVDTRGAGAY